jgi:hypothetical protein
MLALRQPRELDGAKLGAHEHELRADRLGLVGLRKRRHALLFVSTALELRPKSRAETAPDAVDSRHTPSQHRRRDALA